VRTIFLGSPPFAVPVLTKLLASGRHEVLALVTPPDRPRGRGRSIVVSPLVQVALDAAIPVVQPATTRDPGFEETLRGWNPDVLVVASYGELLRTNILELAPHGALNVHGSLLPRWRGASPVQAAILAGDVETGVSIQRMVLALDAGDVLCERKTTIGENEDAGQLAGRLAELGAEALIEALDALESGGAVFTPQDPGLVTHCKKIRKDAGSMDFTRPAQDLIRLVRAMHPWPQAFTQLPDGRRLAVLEAALEPAAGGTHAPGERLPGKDLVVACGLGSLRLVTVKPEGKAAMQGDAFLRGTRLEPGTLLGLPHPS